MTTTSSADATFEALYFSGRKLYGDDFDAQQIAGWFGDEQHGYAELYGSDPARHEYGYTALNEFHGFSQLPPDRRYEHALGFGSNFGDELLPVLHQIKRVTLLDSSDRFVVKRLGKVPVRYVLAQPSGRIALDTASVDLISCFGVLHHIPNVSTVLDEFRRVMSPGGTLLVREPTTSMGDWRQPRLGLTARERGIPRHLLTAAIADRGFAIERAAPCYYPPWVRLCAKLGVNTFDHWSTTAIDSALCRTFDPLWSYHRTHLLAKFAPASLFVTARRDDDADAGEPQEVPAP